jgi:hypothetical protein
MGVYWRLLLRDALVLHVHVCLVVKLPATPKQKAALPRHLQGRSRINRQTCYGLLRMMLIFQGASLPAGVGTASDDIEMISTICRLLGVVGPFPTPVWMSWRAMRHVPCRA